MFKSDIMSSKYRYSKYMRRRKIRKSVKKANNYFLGLGFEPVPFVWQEFKPH